MEYETELVERAQQGDGQAWRVLDDRHRKQIYDYILARCGNHHLADEITEEAMAKAWQAIKIYRGESSFATWLTNIAGNNYKDYLRRVAGYQRMIQRQQALHQQGQSDDPLVSMVRQELAEQLASALASLPDDFSFPVQQVREIVRLRFWEGLQLTEIGRRLGVTPRQVGHCLASVSRYVRARLPRLAE